MYLHLTIGNNSIHDLLLLCIFVIIQSQVVLMLLIELFAIFSFHYHIVKKSELSDASHVKDVMDQCYSTVTMYWYLMNLS